MKPNGRRSFIVILAVACVLSSQVAATHLTGTLIGTARDEQGAAVPGGHVRITSPALIGGPKTMPTSEAGQFRFPNLTPGSYTLNYRLPRILMFASVCEVESLQIGF
jgi:Carboxypeptidase regulatory-like domain